MLYEEMSGWTFKQFMNIRDVSQTNVNSISTWHKKTCWSNVAYPSEAEKDRTWSCCPRFNSSPDVDVMAREKPWGATGTDFEENVSQRIGWGPPYGAIYGAICGAISGPSGTWTLDTWPISSHWGGLKILFCIAIHCVDALQTHPRYHRCIDTLW